MGKFMDRLRSEVSTNRLVKLRHGVVVKRFKSKGPTETNVSVTIKDVEQGFVIDSDGYKNDVVLFLRKNKKDRV